MEPDMSPGSTGSSAIAHSALTPTAPRLMARASSCARSALMSASPAAWGSP